MKRAASYSKKKGETLLGNKFTEEEFILCVENHLGIVTNIVKELGIARDTYYRILKKNPELQKRVDEVNDITLDFVEDALFKRIAEGSDSSIFYYLNHKGHKRGYNLKDGSNVEIAPPPKIVIE